MTDIKFKDISIGQDGSVWAVGRADDGIYRLFGDAGYVGWVPDKEGKAERITAVDWGSAWCVNEANEIWHLTDAESSHNEGTWKMVPTQSGKRDAETISAGNDGSVWYTQKKGTIFRRPEPGDGSSLGSNWIEDKRNGRLKLKVVAVHDKDNVWGIDRKDKIWRWQNGSWSQVLTYNGRTGALSIAVGEDSSVWYVSKDNLLYYYLPFGNSWRQDNNWIENRMGRPEVVAIRNENDVWVMNDDGQVWRSISRNWQQVEDIEPAGKS